MSAHGIGLGDFTVDTGFDEARVEAVVRRHGAAVLPGFVGAEALRALADEFEAALEDDDERYVYRIGYAAGRAVSLLNNDAFAARYPAIAGLFNHDPLVSLAWRYVGVPCLPNYEIYATHETNPAEVVAPKHFDKLWTLKYMLYLADVGPDDAPFGVAPGSMRTNRETFRRIFDEAGIDRLSMSDERYQNMANTDPGRVDDVVPIMAPAGTLIVFDTDTYHYAPAVAPGHERRILRAHSGPSVAYASVAKRSRQWWRGERAYSRLDHLRDRLLGRA